MKMYQKIIAYTLLLGSLAVSSFGCDSNRNPKSAQEGRLKKELSYQANARKESIGVYGYQKHFTDFGMISGFNDLYPDSNVEIELGDMDGDGDLDIVLANKSDGIVQIIENKMPQKNKD